MCFVFIWEQTAFCPTYIIKWLVFITEMKSVYCAVRTGSLNKVVCASYLKGNKAPLHEYVRGLWRLTTSIPDLDASLHTSNEFVPDKGVKKETSVLFTLSVNYRSFSTFSNTSKFRKQILSLVCYSTGTPFYWQILYHKFGVTNFFF